MENLATNNFTEMPIPLNAGDVAGWKEIPIRKPAIEDPLVAMGPFGDYDWIATSSIYFGEHSTNSPYPENGHEGNLLTLFAHQSVAKQLVEAQKLLPPNMRLVVFDSFRSLEVQQSLFDQYYNALAEKNKDWDTEQLTQETQKYVSLPASPDINPNTKYVSPHNTGGAVDLAIYRLPDEIRNRIKEIEKQINDLDAIEGKSSWEQVYKLEMEKISLINRNAEMLDFGTKFDHGGEEAALGYYEKLSQQRDLTPEEVKARNNRRLLYNVMTTAGFEPYADEWWHFNSKKSQMGAKTAGLDHAEFGSAHLSERNLAHEKMRRGHRDGTIKFADGQIPIPSLLNRYALAAREGASIVGNIRSTSLPMVEKIQPPKAA